MTTKANALHSFFSSFGIDAYVNTNVPDGATYPYLTYQYATSSFNQTSAYITVYLYYYSDSEVGINAKAEELSRRLGNGGATVVCDDGIIWIKKGSPFCQAIYEDSAPSVRVRYINIELEYITY